MTANMAPWPVLSGAGEGDDHETLNAALAFVDEFELIEIEPIQVVQHDGHAHRTAAARPCGLSVESATAPSSTGKRSSNRSRTRQKDELVYLRSKVEELEGRLQELKHRHEDKDGKGEAHAREPLAFIWEELAARQYQQRQRAEVENVKLKTMLEEQIRVAKNLERLLKKRSMAELLLVPSSHKRVRKWNETSPLDQPTVFDELMTTLTEMREQVESVFSDERFHCKTPALRDIQARSDEDLGTIVEVFDSRIAPFPLDDIADAVWHHMVKQAFELNSNYQRIVEVTGDTFMREYGADVDMPRFKGSFRGKIVAKRYMEKDRMILLWAALVDPEKVSEMPMDGLLMRQKGWTIVKNPPVDFVQADRPAALTQTYHVIVPEIDEVEGADHRRKVGTLTNFVLNSVDFHLDKGRQMIENLLLVTGWKTPSTTSGPECVVETNGAGREEIDQW